MCGIAGIFNLDDQLVEETLLKKMGDILKHRGPDDAGIFVNTGLGFAHQRLSIIDLSSAGHQPMHSSDGMLTIVYNGEIYNYLELRAELIQLGQSFKSNTDTEVILNAYSHWGDDCLKKLNGMFSFCIWNERKKQLFCARDRFGIKPFYYFWDNTQFIFASEIKALLFHPAVSNEVDDLPVYDFLHWGMLDHSDHTFFKSIKSLPAAHYLLISKSQFIEQRFWDFEISNEIESNHDSPDIFKENFSRTISWHLRSDMPVAFLLSGGLDSSAIVCMANKLEKNNFFTFSSCFPNSRLDESNYIHEVLKKTKTNGHFLTPSSDNFLSELDDLIYHQEEPFGGLSIYVQWCLMREVKNKGVKVVLDGQGADEQLCGYRKFYYFYLHELIKRKKWTLSFREFFFFVTSFSFFSNLQFRQAFLRYFPKSGLISSFENVFLPDFHKKYYDRQLSIGYSGNLSERIKLDLTKYSLPVLLRHEDRNSMAFSVESRVPFLDYQLVEYLASLPLSAKIHSGWTKYVLRQGLKGILPKKIQKRKTKLGFQAPEDLWFRKILLQPTLNTFKNAAFIKRFVDTECLAESFETDFKRKYSLKPASFYFRFFILEHWARVFKVS